MKSVVKYHNDMNQISFGGFTEKELNMFFSLIYLSYEKKERTITVPFSSLKELAGIDRNKDRFIDNLHSINIKLLKLINTIEKDNVITSFPLFNQFTIDKNNNELRIQINEMFSYLLNDLIGNFTKFDLLEFINLKSSYSKNIYKLLKQWDSLGYKVFEITDLKQLLNVPDKYKMCDFTKRVLNPTMEELPRYFENLKIEKIKSGRTVTKLKFTWKKKETTVVTEEKIDYKGLSMTKGEIETIIALNLQNEREWLIKLKTEDYEAYKKWKYYKNIERSDYDILMFWHKLKADKIVENVTKIVPRWEREPKEEIQSEFLDYDISWLTE